MRIIVAGGILLLVAVVAMYVFNPSGTATSDPRARVLGYTVYNIPSVSMNPTLERGDYIGVSAFAYVLDSPARGELVVYVPPGKQIPFVGRVVATAGDELTVTGGVLFLNGERIDEPFIQSRGKTCHVADIENVRVPDGHLFMMGDNRCNSVDSRMFGPVSVDRLVGRISVII